MPDHIILKAKPSIIPAIIWLAPGILFLCLVAYAANALSVGRIQILQLLYGFIALLIIILSGGRTLIELIDRQATTYTLTDSQLLIKRGFFESSNRPIPRTQILNAEVHDTFGSRAFGYGSVIVNTFAGPKVLRYVPNPKRWQEEINTRIRL
jgi:uncharacterized membrane protein YdbT with pleckstrin-like domain